MSDDLAHVRAQLEHLARIQPPDALRPSENWADNLERRHRPVIASAASADQVIQTTTKNRGFFTLPCHRTDPYFPSVCAAMLEFFERDGYSLDALPLSVCESTYVAPEVIFHHHERALSTAFLWQLALASRIRNCVAPVNVILEIGGGYGGLARAVKLLTPGVRYFLLDFPECLAFAYLFLRRNFPGANIQFATDGGLPLDADFVLVPTCFVEMLSDASVDLVVNSQSLSEMRQAAYDYYLDLIERRIEPRFFYNVNRYAQHADGLVIRNRKERYNGSDVCSHASVLDPHWEVRHWATSPEDHWAGCDPRYARVLELLVERVPAANRDEARYAMRAQELRDEARWALRADSRLNYLLWDANRLAPTANSLQVYIDLLDALAAPEAAFYRQRLQELSGVEPRTPPNARRPALDLSIL